MTDQHDNRNTEAATQPPTHPNVIAGVSLHFARGDRAHTQAYWNKQTRKFVLTIADKPCSLIDFTMQSTSREQLETILTEALGALRALPDPDGEGADQ